MINSITDLAAVNEDGSLVLPIGPCSAWPQSRNVAGPGAMHGQRDTKVKASLGKMMQGVAQAGIAAVTQGRLDATARDKRYKTCQECQHFIVDSKRCSECGCFMEAKTWLAGASCPIDKW